MCALLIIPRPVPEAAFCHVDVSGALAGVDVGRKDANVLSLVRAHMCRQPTQLLLAFSAFPAFIPTLVGVRYF